MRLLKKEAVGVFSVVGDTILMFDFIDKLLQKFTAPAVGFQTSFLPCLEITEKLRDSVDKEYLDFITNLFLAATKDPDYLKQENRFWFLEEIAYHLRLCYPNLSMQEYELILQQLIDKESKETE